jgi:TPR repeat protein
MNRIHSETMANREELGIIRGARAGDAVCQLALGKLYLFGGASLPLSVPTALHWLNRAALQDQEQAWLLIGSHIPYEHAQHCLPGVLSWYERAYDAGIAHAGLVLAQLVLQASAHDTSSLRDKARQALEMAARAGLPEAQWLLAHQLGARPAPAAAPLPAEGVRPRELAAAEQDRHCPVRPRPVVRAHAHRRPPTFRAKSAGSGAANFKKAVRWLQQAGEQGLAEAWYALSRIYVKPEFSQRNVVEAQKYLERAAEMGYRDAQLECGNAAWRARRENEGNDVRAVFWLQKAAAQGCAKAAAMLRKIAPRSRAPGRIRVRCCLGATCRNSPAAGGAAGTGLAVRPEPRRSAAAGCEGMPTAAIAWWSTSAPATGAAGAAWCLAGNGAGAPAARPHRAPVRERRLRPGGPEGNYRQRLYRLQDPAAPAAATTWAGYAAARPRPHLGARSRSDRDLAFEHGFGRAAQVDRLAFAGPGDAQAAAARRRPYRRCPAGRAGCRPPPPRRRRCRRPGFRRRRARTRAA